MVEQINPNETTIVSGDFSFKNKLKKIAHGKKTSSKTEHNTIISQTGNPKNRKVRTKKWIVFFGVLLLVAILIIFTIYDRNIAGLSCRYNYTSQCAIKDAAKLLKPEKAQELYKVVLKIQKIKNYQKNPNLLYVEIVYYINISDGKNASIYYNMLEKVYNPDVGFSKKLGDQILTILQIRSSVEFLNTWSDTVNHNFENTYGGATR